MGFQNSQFFPDYYGIDDASNLHIVSNMAHISILFGEALHIFIFYNLYIYISVSEQMQKGLDVTRWIIFVT